MRWAELSCADHNLKCICVSQFWKEWELITKKIIWRMFQWKTKKIKKKIKIKRQDKNSKSKLKNQKLKNK